MTEDQRLSFPVQQNEGLGFDKLSPNGISLVQAIPLPMRSEVVRNRRPDPQAQRISLIDGRDVSGLDAGIGLPVAIGIVGGFIDREIVDGGGRNRKGPAELGERVVDPQREDHFQHIVATDVVGAGEGWDLHRLQEHVLHQSEAQGVERTQRTADIFTRTIVRGLVLGQPIKQTVQL